MRKQPTFSMPPMTFADFVLHLAIIVGFVIYITTKKRAIKKKIITTTKSVPVLPILLPHEIQQKIMLEYWLNIFEDLTKHRKELVNEYNETVEGHGVAVRIKHQIELDIDTIDGMTYTISIAKKGTYEKERKSILSKLQIISAEIQRLQERSSLLLGNVYEKDIDRKIALNYINKLAYLTKETDMCNERIATIDLQSICMYGN